MADKRIHFAMMILCLAVLLAPQKSAAFGLVVEHVLFTYDEPTKLADIDKKSVEAELDIHQNLLTQVGATTQMRQILGDTRIMYEKDRLIETLKDYDTIMRSLLFFQIRDKDIINNDINKSFTNFNAELLRGVAITNMANSSDSAVMRDAWSVLGNILSNPVSPILQEQGSATSLISDPSLAGDNFKATQFLHAYTTKDKKRIPASIDETMYTYRQALINEVATRNFLLGIYARSYLAERAEGNGIGRFLYGNEVILWQEPFDPWAKSLNIIGGIAGAIMGNFESALQTVTTVISDIMNNGIINTVGNAIGSLIDTLTGRAEVGSGTNLVSTPAEPPSEITSLSSGAAIDITTEPLQDACPKDLASTKAPRDQYMECIWNKFMASKSTDLPVNYTFSGKDKAQQRIILTSIRQMIAINTIMWVRASLEVSNLILLSSAQLEMEAILAMMGTGWFWIYPASSTAWGETKCTLSSDIEDRADGTGWSQTCLTEQERLWITPTFDWTEVDLGAAKK